MLRNRLLVGHLVALVLVACGDDNDATRTQPLLPEDAGEVVIDRFGEAGTLMVRNETNGLPEPGAPIDFDRAPFITHGLGPDGQRVGYYNFDVQSTDPAPIYVLFREGEATPLPAQLNIVGTVPGQAGYNDFWRVHRVTVPRAYVANAATSLEQLVAAGYEIEATDKLVNCPIVPRESSARLRLNGADASLTQGWYQDQVVYYFNFEERALAGTQVPLAGIYVTFNINPGQAGGGPPSGFRAEADMDQTHNVLTDLPGSRGYSPLWSVSPYDNADFEKVHDLPSAASAGILARDVATVNCPVVETGD